MRKLYSEHTLLSSEIKNTILQNSVEINGFADIDILIDKIGDAKYVLLGEASHGTHEYYTWRTQISKQLIEKKGFSFIAVEGDWPDCYALNRYVRNYKDAGISAFDVLHQFNRWPTWMWANWEVVAMAEWLRKHNDQLPQSKKTGFYGLDVYSLWESLHAIIDYLKKVDKDAWQTAMKAFRCFEPYSEEEGQSYARATQMYPVSCEKEVINLLLEIMNKLPQYNTDHEAVFSAEQNAFVLLNAEKYYRIMAKAGPDSWNIRDHHMMETLNRLMNFHGRNAKAIVWEHNSHIGDARATDMSAAGLQNVGELARSAYGKEVYTIGFGSYTGTVIAGKSWGDEMRLMNVPPAKSGSWEHALHQMDGKDRFVFMTEELKKAMDKKIFPHRAIGVVYHPNYERHGNYVPSLMHERYDAFVYLNETSALHPLHIQPDGHQMPETYPFGT